MNSPSYLSKLTLEILLHESYNFSQPENREDTRLFYNPLAAYVTAKELPIMFSSYPILETILILSNYAGEDK